MPTSSTESRPSHTIQRPRFGLSQVEPREDVEDTESATHDDEMLLSDDPTSAMPSVEQVRTLATEGAAAPGHVLYSPKRRRIDNAHITSDRGVQHQPTPARSFIPQSDQDSHRDDHASSTTRPAFLKSSLPTKESAEPLPEAFSPQKRGQRFVHGGMAAELRTWISETGNAAVHARRGRAYLHGEDYAIVLKVLGVAGEDPVFVQGERVEDRAVVHAILVGERDRTGSRRTKITIGDKVGIREPTWTVDVLNKQWIVGVDYRLISE